MNGEFIRLHMILKILIKNSKMTLIRCTKLFWQQIHWGVTTLHPLWSDFKWSLLINLYDNTNKYAVNSIYKWVLPNWTEVFQHPPPTPRRWTHLQDVQVIVQTTKILQSSKHKSIKIETQRRGTTPTGDCSNYKYEHYKIQNTSIKIEKQRRGTGLQCWLGVLWIDLFCRKNMLVTVSLLIMHRVNSILHNLSSKIMFSGKWNFSWIHGFSCIICSLSFQKQHY